MKKILFTLFTIFVFKIGFSFDYDINSLCKHPDKEELYVGGSFDLIFVVNAVNGDYIKSFEFEGGVDKMAFGPDGKSLLATVRNKTYKIDPNTGEILLTIAGNAQFFKGQYIFTITSYSKKGIDIYDANEFKHLWSQELEFSPQFVGVNDYATKIILLSRGEKIKNEKKLIKKEVKKVDGYNTYNSAYLKDQSDSKGSKYVVLNLLKKTIELNTVIPYAPTASFSHSIAGTGGEFYFAGWDEIINIKSNGDSYPVEYSNPTFSYASASSLDGNLIVVASTQNGYIYNCTENTFQEFKCNEDFSAPYTRDALFTDDKLFLINADYSFDILNHDAQLIKSVQIEKASENGFGVYYSIGYRDAERRQNEQTEVNTILKNLSLPEITFIEGERNSKIAETKTYSEAAAISEKLKDSGIKRLMRIAPLK